jgi:hypothetical protein
LGGQIQQLARRLGRGESHHGIGPFSQLAIVVLLAVDGLDDVPDLAGIFEEDGHLHPIILPGTGSHGVFCPSADPNE